MTRAEGLARWEHIWERGMWKKGEALNVFGRDAAVVRFWAASVATPLLPPKCCYFIKGYSSPECGSGRAVWLTATASLVLRWNERSRTAASFGIPLNLTSPRNWGLTMTSPNQWFVGRYMTYPRSSKRDRAWSDAWMGVRWLRRLRQPCRRPKSSLPRLYAPCLSRTQPNIGDNRPSWDGTCRRGGTAV